MTLPLPQLDNRTFDELVAESRALIPRYAPGWTDHNAHDPGITLLELFAWLTEQISYRLDRVPDPHYRSFLRLLGAKPRPAQVAETVLVVGLKPGGNPVLLPARLQIANTDGSIVFQTVRKLFVSTAKLVTVLTGNANNFVDRSSDNAPQQSKPYPPLGAHPRRDDALYLGFDRQLADGPATISLYVWAGQAEEDRETWRRLEAEWHTAQTIATTVCFPGQKPDLAEWRQHYSARTIWEYHSGAGKWAPLTQVVDHTRSLSLSGSVRFKAPNPNLHKPGGVSLAQHAKRYFIRCRLASGAYDCSPQIQKVAVNAALARHVSDIEMPEKVGTSHGWAGEAYTLQRRPVVPGSTKVRVRMNGTDDGVWREKLTWDRVGPHDRAYVLSPESGTLTFGNGRQGHVPRAGADITVTYQVGGGSIGNVPPGKLTRALEGAHNESLISSWSAVRPMLDIVQPFAATGGKDAESLTEAKARALTLLAKPRCAVTLKDIETLALEVPGVPVARVRAIADYDPALPSVPALGSITVVVMPKCAEVRPMPSREMLREVQHYLERRRLITTELHVIGPEYAAVAIHARLHAEPGAKADTLIWEAQSALGRFFHPLYGEPDKSGWPIGRDIHRSEILALLNEIPGVTHVDSLIWQIGKDREVLCGNVTVCSHSLILSGRHVITVMKEDGLESCCSGCRKSTHSHQAHEGSRYMHE